MFTLIIVVFFDLSMQPQVTEKSFDKLPDCEAAAHTYLVTPANWPAKAYAVGAGCKVNVKR
jgi:hypothetical protein